MAIVRVAHDYATQRGGAERVAALLARHYDSPIWVSVYEPAATGGLFDDVRVETSWANRWGLVRRNRLLLSLVMPLVIFWTRLSGSGTLICSSSGWAHGLRWSGPKVVYCHNPARWLYQADDYFEGSRWWVRRVTRLLLPLRWLDRRWAGGADMYVANSQAVAERVRDIYGITARVINPPVSLRRTGGLSAPTRSRRTFLTVARARSYKGVEHVIAAFSGMPDADLVIVGSAATDLPRNVTVRTGISDDELARLYLSATGLIAVSREDFGLTPIEAHAHGCPVLALRAGGYLDSVVEGINGIFIESVTPEAISKGVGALTATAWDEALIRKTAERFSEDRFFGQLDAALADAATIHAHRGMTRQGTRYGTPAPSYTVQRGALSGRPSARDRSVVPPGAPSAG